MTTTLAAPQSTVRYHPIRGAVYGLLFGFGLALVLMVFKVLALSVPFMIVLGMVFLVLGGVWGRFAPPRGPKTAPVAERPTMTGAPRTTAAPSPTPPPAPPPPPPTAPSP